MGTMKKKIFVVDNHPMILKLMANLLEKGGYDVMTAGDGLSALDILKTFTPDVIFIDLVMPNISGEKLCKIIRGMSQFKETYIVILSAIAVEEEINFTAYGADACIAKGPFKKIAEHVSFFLDERFKGGTQKDYSKEIIGYNDLFEREVTKELLSSKRHFEAILDDISEGILELTEEGRVIYANPTAVKFFGMPEEKLLSVLFPNFFGEKDKERVGKTLAGIGKNSVIIGEENPASLNNKLVTLNFLPVKDDAIRSIIVIILDVTERLKAEKELSSYRKHLEELVKERTAKLLERTKELQEQIAERNLAVQERQKLQIQLQQTQKMEAVGTLAGGIAHDFNNILSAILGYAELSQTQIPQESKPHEYLSKIIKSVERAADLVKQILTFSRQAEQERKPMQLQPIVKESLKLLRGSLPSTIEIKKDIDPACRPILASFSQMHQVIMNLCTNAYHAMRKNGGVLSVTLAEADLPPELSEQQPELRPGRYAKLVVADTGSGIEKNIQERIFEPYFTTKKHGEGTGLGLATVHGIVMSHEGTIAVKSEPGKGASFEVYFPTLEKHVVMDQIVKVEISPVPISARVLFVDDEEMIVELAESVLERMNCDVVALSNGIEAFAAFEKDPHGFDIVITDQTMPGLTGIELAQKILAIRPDMPIILATGFSEMVNEKKAKEIGIREFIMKPLAIRDLSQAVWKVLGDQNDQSS
jgi:PAS domain S-box-containing protein